MQDRRVEITGPVDRKMVINALNSGAKTFMADFEDSNTPTWENTINGQVNMRDAVARTIEFSQADGKRYALKDEIATLIVRPRGWHMEEKHVLIDGEPASASIFDFGLYLFHNHAEAKRQGTAPYFYLPKMESHLEARLWNDVFVMAQDDLGMEQGTIKGTVLIETILAAFEMDEILRAPPSQLGAQLRPLGLHLQLHQEFGPDPDFVLADRALVTMTTHFMRRYSLLAIQTCHRRNARHGRDGRTDPDQGRRGRQHRGASTRCGPTRSARPTTAMTGRGCAPGLVPIAMDAFNAVMKGPNQIDRKREDVNIAASDLLDFGPAGPITRKPACGRTSTSGSSTWAPGSRNRLCAAVQPHEDAATAEISRSQVWQWSTARTACSTTADHRYGSGGGIVDEEMAIREVTATRPVTTSASELFVGLISPEEFTDFSRSPRTS